MCCSGGFVSSLSIPLSFKASVQTEFVGQQDTHRMACFALLTQEAVDVANFRN